MLLAFYQLLFGTSKPTPKPSQYVLDHRYIVNPPARAWIVNPSARSWTVNPPPRSFIVSIAFPRTWNVNPSPRFWNA